MIKTIVLWRKVLAVSLLVPGYVIVSGVAVGESESKIIKWGGSGFDRPNVQDLRRFTAEIEKTDPGTSTTTLKIRFDAKDAWEELKELSLTANDGRKLASTNRIGKHQRHLSAPWVCIFSPIDIKELPDEGLIIAKNSEGETILSEKTDFRPLKKLLIAEQ